MMCSTILPDLSADLIGDISSYLDSKSIAKLSLTNRRMHRAVQGATRHMCRESIGCDNDENERPLNRDIDSFDPIYSWHCLKVANIFLDTKGYDCVNSIKGSDPPQSCLECLLCHTNPQEPNSTSQSEYNRLQVIHGLYLKGFKTDSIVTKVTYKLYNISTNVLKAGHFIEAVEIAGLLVHKDVRVRAYYSISERLLSHMRRRTYDKVTISRSKKNHIRSNAERAMVIARSERMDENFKKIAFPFLEVYKLIEDGCLEQAKRNVKDIKASPWSSQALQEICEKALDMGEIEYAVRTTAEIPYYFGLDSFMREFGEKVLKKEDCMRNVLDMVKTMSHRDSKTRVLYHISTSLASSPVSKVKSVSGNENNNIDEALRVANMLDDTGIDYDRTYGRSHALQTIAKRILLDDNTQEENRDRNLSYAYEIAEKIPSSIRKADTMRAITASRSTMDICC